MFCVGWLPSPAYSFSGGHPCKKKIRGEAKLVPPSATRGWDGHLGCVDRPSAFTNQNPSASTSNQLQVCPLSTHPSALVLFRVAPLAKTQSWGETLANFFSGGETIAPTMVSTLLHPISPLDPSFSSSRFLSFHLYHALNLKSSHIYSLPFLSFSPSTATSNPLNMTFTFLYRPHLISFLLSTSLISSTETHNL